MKHAVSTLEGALLDAAVAKADGVEVELTSHSYADGRVEQFCVFAEDDLSAFRPSADWSQGGPIIEREGMSVGYSVQSSPSLAWWATAGSGPYSRYSVYGPTALIAAMRGYVASKLGVEVEL